MAYRHFALQLVVRSAWLVLTMAVLTWLLVQPGLHGLTLLALTVLVLSVTELWHHVSRTNRNLARFLECARHSDFSQRFPDRGMGSGFDELGQVYNDILERQRAAHARKEAGNRHLRAMIEHIPVPLMTVHDDHSITLQNNAARRLFGAAAVSRLDDLAQFGESFRQSVEWSVPGVRELVAFTVENVEYCLTLAATEIISEGRKERLISLQDIQTELDQSQAQAWQDLVRVLTHEIMNSITPVTSLAATARDVVDDIMEKTTADDPMAEDLENLKLAVATLSHRSSGLMNFVDSYRQITRLKPPDKRRIALLDLFENTTRLARAEWADKDVVLEFDVQPKGLDVMADRDLLEPVLLNLLRNAWQAAAVDGPARIELSARLNRRGRVVIEVRDNGPGVPEGMARQIFVPFFTTKENGSGVGLALARQVMIAHGGFIRLVNGPGGAVFVLTF
ncbi:MAG: ATP-binding protein [Xanthomonadales bacterium]|jgi:nitrogen fixation/metabolism regulation signal transduction histidine kinase|nr:ATP-binding protein [Xanthomonadales bacterium]